MVQRVEKFSAELKLGAFGDAEFPRYSKVHRLQSRPVNCVASRVAEGKGSRRGERCRVEPLGGRARARSKDCLAGVVGADRVLAQYGAGIGSVAKDRNREWE